jgi:hypothetical protein
MGRDSAVLASGARGFHYWSARTEKSGLSRSCPPIVVGGPIDQKWQNGVLGLGCRVWALPEGREGQFLLLLRRQAPWYCTECELLLQASVVCGGGVWHGRTWEGWTPCIYCLDSSIWATGLCPFFYFWLSWRREYDKLISYLLYSKSDIELYCVWLSSHPNINIWRRYIFRLPLSGFNSSLSTNS